MSQIKESIVADSAKNIVEPTPPPPSIVLAKSTSASSVLAASLLLAACGGGGDETAPPIAGPAPGPSPGPNPTPAPPGTTPAPAPNPSPVPPPAAIIPTAKQAARFLQMATLGAAPTDVTALQTKSLDAWFEEQVALPKSQGHWDWLIANGYGLDADKNNRSPIDYSLWRKLISSNDQLRQRMVFALSQIFVIGIDGVGGSWPHFSSAAYLDILEDNAFGNFRVLLEKVTLNIAMGYYLSHRGNRKEDVNSGRLPDENYAREVMQLFTIGLYELNADGSVKVQNGNAVETYDQVDVSGLARVFTGWDFDPALPSTSPDRNRAAMVLKASDHSPLAKVFLTANIPANTNGTESLKLALDTLFSHPNVGPFIGRQLIQRLVTSNPSPAYVQRVASVFDSSNGFRGDLKATLKAVLFDVEAINPPATATGKLNEPVLRFTAWARAFGVTSSTNKWAENTTDPATRLGQSPLRSNSVFNFFRPGYVPPSTTIGSQGLVAPELQITHETSVAGYINYIQSVVSASNTNLTPNYDAWLSKVDTVDALLAELNLLLAADRLSAATIATIKTGVQSIATTTDAGKKNRLYAAITLVMASPEFLSFI